MPDFSFEKKLNRTGLIVGLDEAGRGPWCGPVVAACVGWQDFQCPPDLANQINDSKKLTPQKREILFDQIISATPVWGIGQASAKEIDEINILQASFLAMRRALDEVIKKGFKPITVLIDGNRLPDWDVEKYALIGGDGKSLSVAAASILAKVTRDRIMTELAQKYPYYGWEKNAGYGTKAHQEGLAKYGITPEHRQSYAPIRKILENNCKRK
ncbi:MAG: ribonuclease HII [Alphaproteobacteria bacterium]|nr:ribonuclease HII [Alphaproteobacteria bacterium]